MNTDTNNTPSLTASTEAHVDRPDQISREELLTAENLSLRLMQTRTEAQMLQMQLSENHRKQTTEAKELDAYRQVLSEKYNIDFTRFEIEAGTGRIIPKN